jgi:predicted Zn-dependent peptidase
LIHSVTLENGVTLLCEPVPGVETCSVGFWYPTGSRDESAAERGHAHFLEHMLFKGTARRTARDIAIEIDRVGGALNAFTEKESTCYYCSLPAEHLGLAVDVLADMVTAATLPAAEIDKEKAVVVSEIEAAEDSPEEKGYQLFVESMWPQHGLSAKVAGEPDQVRSIERDALLDYYRGRCAPANLTVSVAGPVDVPSLTASLGSLPVQGAAVYAANRQAPVERVERRFVRERYHQAQLYLGASMPPSGDIREYLAFVVLSTAFGESMSSRLFQRIREDEGLCYSVGSFRTHYSDTWSWTIYATAVPDLLKKLLLALNREMVGLMNMPLTEEEVRDAVNHLVGSMVFAKEEMETRMRRMLGQLEMFGRVTEIDEAADLLRTIEAADVAAVAAKLIRPGAVSLLSYGTRNVGELEKVSLDF